MQINTAEVILIPLYSRNSRISSLRKLHIKHKENLQSEYFKKLRRIMSPLLDWPRRDREDFFFLKGGGVVEDARGMREKGSTTTSNHLKHPMPKSSYTSCKEDVLSKSIYKGETQ